MQMEGSNSERGGAGSDWQPGWWRTFASFKTDFRGIVVCRVQISAVCMFARIVIIINNEQEVDMVHR